MFLATVFLKPFVFCLALLQKGGFKFLKLAFNQDYSGKPKA
jgi:hypothetical protein